MSEIKQMSEITNVRYYMKGVDKLTPTTTEHTWISGGSGSSPSLNTPAMQSEMCFMLVEMAVLKSSRGGGGG